MQCPDCGGPMWDNRAKKASGAYKASRSDFSCKNKEGCGKGVWLKDSEKSALQAKASTGMSGQTQRRPIVIDALMEQCLVAAASISRAQNITAGELVLNMATTMFIARVNRQPGILKVEKEGLAKAQAKAAELEKKRKTEEAEEARRREAETAQNRSTEFEDFPGALEENDDDDLPF